MSKHLIPPGEFIRDELNARGWGQSDLAEIMGRPVKTVSQIVNGSKAITTSTAKQLAAVFGTSPTLWMNLESAYRLALDDFEADDIVRRAAIYDKFPVAEMVRRKWIEKCANTHELERELARFQGALTGAARKSAEQTTGSEVAWLCRVREMASSVSTPHKFTRNRLEKHLDELRALTVSEQEVRKVPDVLGQMGIRFLIVQHLQGTRIDGYTLWLDKDKPVIVMSLRYDRIDGFWHTLAHELSHVRHGDRPPIDVNLVGSERMPPTDEMERRADMDAGDWLIGTSTLESFVVRTAPRFSKRRIMQFANLHQIHPGIVVGQLQYRGHIKYSHNREMLVGIRDLLTETTLTDGWGHTLGG